MFSRVLIIHIHICSPHNAPRLSRQIKVCHSGSHSRPACHTHAQLAQLSNINPEQLKPAGYVTYTNQDGTPAACNASSAALCPRGTIASKGLACAASCSPGKDFKYSKQVLPPHPTQRLAAPVALLLLGKQVQLVVKQVFSSPHLFIVAQWCDELIVFFHEMVYMLGCLTDHAITASNAG